MTKKRGKKGSTRKRKTNAGAPKLSPAARAKARAEAHVNRPVRNCRCPSCQTHRYLDRQTARDHASALIHDLAVGPVTVTLSRNATQALREALGLNTNER